MIELKHVVLSEAVHYKMFSWRTACGKVFDPSEKEDSQEWVTCRVCLRSRVHDYEYLNEYGPYGVGVVNESAESERMEKNYGVTEHAMRSYTIRMFHPFMPGERVEVFATLPSDEMAINLGEMLTLWREDEFERDIVGLPLEPYEA